MSKFVPEQDAKTGRWLPGGPSEPLQERLDHLVIPEPNSGCHLFTGALSTAGYGQIGVNRRVLYAHRVAYELYVGPIPDGMVIDHLCRVRCCVNPAHLEVVSHRENILRGNGYSARNARAAACPRGHPRTDDGMYVLRDGTRRCRPCHQADSRARYAARKKAALR